MNENLSISVIIAVYQRPDELTELLQSLSSQSDSDFEVVVVDDGSPEKLENLIQDYKKLLNLKYFYKENSGPGKSRNYGMERASGNYFIFLDSDTIAPQNYIATVRKELTENYVDAFGGPDAADESFSDLQKAISFSMTSFLTTGGIRGGKKHVGKFQPRSFNMGISKAAFEETGGFGNLRIGEDPDLSMTLWEKGFETRLFSDAKVFHKRRTSLKKFAKQVHQFGVARPILNQRHPKYTKLTFWFPTLFLLYFLFSLFLFVYGVIDIKLYASNVGAYWVNYFGFLLGLILISPLIIYFILLFIISSIKYRNLNVGILSLVTTFVQFFCYGYGFLMSWFHLNVANKKPEQVFPENFQM
ncbi:MAG: glycosyltransferase [Moheibacter sp.]